MGKDEKPQEKRPACPRKRLNDKGRRIVCMRPAVWAVVKGEFTSSVQLLCNPCIIELRGKGWNVRYQIEGDNPPPLEEQTIG